MQLHPILIVSGGRRKGSPLRAPLAPSPHQGHHRLAARCTLDSTAACSQRIPACHTATSRSNRRAMSTANLTTSLPAQPCSCAASVNFAYDGLDAGGAAFTTAAQVGYRVADSALPHSHRMSFLTLHAGSKRELNVQAHHKVPAFDPAPLRSWSARGRPPQVRKLNSYSLVALFAKGKALFFDFVSYRESQAMGAAATHGAPPAVERQHRWSACMHGFHASSPLCLARGTCCSSTPLCKPTRFTTNPCWHHAVL